VSEACPRRFEAGARGWADNCYPIRSITNINTRAANNRVGKVTAWDGLNAVDNHTGHNCFQYSEKATMISNKLDELCDLPSPKVQSMMLEDAQHNGARINQARTKTPSNMHGNR